MRIILLGPQRHVRTVSDTCRDLGVEGSIATITAGWEERELEDEELDLHLGGCCTNLQLWERCEKVFERDPKLFRGLRARHDKTRAMQRLYRLRLDHATAAARELYRIEGEDDLVRPELDAAIEAVRTIDAEHQSRVRDVLEQFERDFEPKTRPAIVRERREIEGVVDGAAAIALAGGHVAVLMNRLRLFDFPALIGVRPIIAWSAGAMALGERIVLFHDNPPQGRGNAEVLEAGLDLYHGLIPFPHARHRLRLDDAERVALLARRFAPAACVPMDDGDRVEWDGGTWRFARGARTLEREGIVHEVTA